MWGEDTYRCGVSVGDAGLVRVARVGCYYGSRRWVELAKVGPIGCYRQWGERVGGAGYPQKTSAPRGGFGLTCGPVYTRLDAWQTHICLMETISRLDSGTGPHSRKRCLAQRHALVLTYKP